MSQQSGSCSLDIQMHLPLSALCRIYLEKEFWFSIWQIIHLADYEHEQDGVTKKELTKALNFLEHIEEIPMNCIGERP